MDFLNFRIILFPAPRLLSETVAKYLGLIHNPTQLSYYVSELLTQLQNELADENPEVRAFAVQRLIFLNSMGHDTAWADFAVLEVMSIDNYSCKRVAYTAASQTWQPHSDVVLMATNRVQKDLTSNNPYFTSLALTSIAPFLSNQLSQDIASDVILQLNSSKSSIRQKAAITFYHICLRYPDALRPGFAALKSRLDDEDSSVVFAVLTVMCELCRINPKNFVGFIPKLFKMLNNCPSNWATLRILTLFRILSTVEQRLPKKLVQPLTIILETTPSVFIMYECVKAIIEIPISNESLLAAATYRLQSFLNDFDPNLRFLCLSLFIKLMKIQPKLVSQHRDLISMCLDSENELERMMALDLMSNLVTPKTIDTVVGKMFAHFQESSYTPFRDEMIHKVIDMCTKDDYELIQDFEWFISVLMDFVESGGFSCGGLIAQNFTELAYRIPDMRPRLVTEMGSILDNRCCSELMLAACHIISEFADNSELFPKILQPIIIDCDDRVQEACLTTSFFLYLKCKTEDELDKIELMFDLKLPLFLQSSFIEIQEMASSLIELISSCKTVRNNGNFELFKESFLSRRNESFEEIEVPSDINDPLTIFDGNDEDELDVLYPYIRKKHHKKRHHHHKSRDKTGQQNDNADDNDSNEENNENDQQNSKKDNNNNNDNLVKEDVFVERMIRRKQHRQKKETNPEDLPVSGPTYHSRIQILGKNSSISISATEFVPVSKNLEIALEIQNLSKVDIPMIDFSIVETANIRKVSTEPLNTGIEANGSVQHSITINVDNIFAPQIVKMIVVPISGETLETRLKIFPSYFLNPVGSALLSFAEPKIASKKSMSFELNVKPREVLQSTVNVLQSNIIEFENGINSEENKKSKTLISKTSTGEYVLAKLTYEDSHLIIEVGSPEEKLSISLLKEVELKLRSLSP